MNKLSFSFYEGGHRASVELDSRIIFVAQVVYFVIGFIRFYLLRGEITPPTSRQSGASLRQAKPAYSTVQYSTLLYNILW